MKTLLSKPGRSPVSFSGLVHHGVSGTVAEGLEAGSENLELCPGGNVVFEVSAGGGLC